MDGNTLGEWQSHNRRGTPGERLSIRGSRAVFGALVGLAAPAGSESPGFFSRRTGFDNNSMGWSIPCTVSTEPPQGKTT